MVWFMKLLRVVFLALAALLAAVLTLVMVAYFSPAVQKRLVLGAIPEAPGRSVQVEHVKIGLSKIELRGFFLLQGVEGIQLDALEVEYAPLAALRGELVIKRGRVSNLLVDISHTGLLPFGGGTGPGVEPAPAAHTQPAPELQPILNQLEARGLTLRVDDLSGDFHLLAPGDQRVSARFAAKGIAPGATGTVQLDIEQGSSLPARRPDNEISARVELTQLADGRFERIELRTDASLKMAALQSGKLMLGSRITVEPDGEGERVRVQLVAPTVAEPLLAMDARIDYAAQRASGTLNSTLRAEDLAAIGWTGAVPGFTYDWQARFESALGHAEGLLESRFKGRVWDLGKVMEGAPDPGPLDFEKVVNLQLRDRQLTINTYTARISDQAGNPLLAVSVPQVLTLALDRMSEPLAQLSGTLLDVRLERLPLDWLGSVMEGIELSAEPVSGRLLVSAADGVLTLAEESAVSLRGLNMAIEGEPLLRAIDVELRPQYRMDGTRHTLGLRSLSVTGDGAPVLSATMSGEFAPAGGAESPRRMSMSGSAEIHYPGILAQPAFGGAPVPRSGVATVRFEASVTGGAGEGQMTAELPALVYRTEKGERRFAGSKQVRFNWSGSERIGMEWIAALRGPAGSSDLAGSGSLNMTGGQTNFALSGTSKMLWIDDYLELVGLLTAGLKDVEDEPSAPSPAPSQPSAAGAPPPWQTLNGTVDVEIAELRRGELRVTDAALSARVDRGGVTAKITGSNDGSPFNLHLQVQHFAGADKPYALVGSARLPQWNLGPWAAAFSASDAPLIDGIFDIDADISGQAESLAGLAAAVTGKLDIAATRGTLRPLGEFEGVASVLQLGLGLWQASRKSKSDGIDIAQELIGQLREVPIERLKMQAERALDGSIKLSQVNIAGGDLHFSGSGLIAAVAGKPLTEAPMRLEFRLNGRNRLGNYLRELKLASDQTDELGFFVGPTFAISGTPGDPKSTLSSLILSAGAQYLQSRRAAEPAPQP